MKKPERMRLATRRLIKIVQQLKRTSCAGVVRTCAAAPAGGAGARAADTALALSGLLAAPAFGNVSNL
ncbi:hypothetical protein EVAR_25501_1 [Eumeta japonica]|uniref:Uncharacterized protein n=1 Tax=Eumeta variegata TaxID=151549 RepID=A0A4C1VMV2_EUMVA|nr:hypothetical protein EVAR_25501_1 [Eumeta japonica]